MNYESFELETRTATPSEQGLAAFSSQQQSSTTSSTTVRQNSTAAPASVSPRPVTLETIREGAGITVTRKQPTPYEIVLGKIDEVVPSDLRELANQYFGRPALEANGGERSQSLDELIVLVVKHFEHWTDEMGLGARLINGIPHLYGGTHWKPVSNSELGTLLGNFALRLGCDSVKFEYYATREKLVSQFLSTHGGTPEHPPGRASRVNFLNGTLEISESGIILRAFQKDDLLTYQLPFAYDPNANCPMFDKYLNEVLPDPTAQQVLAEFIAWLFLPDLKLERILVLLGDGHNGKSVFFDIVCALLGEQNVTNFGLTALDKMENRLPLGSALLNFGSEISSRCNPDLLKKLASGEPIEARRLYQDPCIMRQYARLAFNANVLPPDVEHTNGFFRRFLIVPFDQTISEQDKDPELAKKIIEDEMAGTFNWVIVALLRLRQQKKFTTCVASEAALSTYRKESDSVAGFLDEGGWVASADDRTGKMELYRLYSEYCRNSGFRQLSKCNFGKRLLNTHKIGESKSGSARYWHLHQAQDH